LQEAETPVRVSETTLTLLKVPGGKFWFTYEGAS
jgi:hypothetical protein